MTRSMNGFPCGSKELPGGSLHRGRLPAGCISCAKGAKLVLFITGRCLSVCYYCPLSEKKVDRDVIFADEMRVKKTADIIQEAQLIRAEGTGITGGDPLLPLPRTLRYIRLLKNKFGIKHHIHLYTSTPSVPAIKKLAAAGLDEIRFHPPSRYWAQMEKTEFVNAIRVALKNNLDVGVEVPAIPGKERQLVALANFLEAEGTHFLNLNELEFSETNAKMLKAHGFKIKDEVSSGVMGSRETALTVLHALGPKTHLTIHYCSSSFKDKVQLKKRIMRRAKSIARKGDIITKEGLLLKGVIETKQPYTVRLAIIRDFGVPSGLIYLDLKKNRVEIAPWVLEDIAPSLAWPAYIIEEYPTADRLEVERERIN